MHLENETDESLDRREQDHLDALRSLSSTQKQLANGLSTVQFLKKFKQNPSIQCAAAANTCSIRILARRR